MKYLIPLIAIIMFSTSCNKVIDCNEGAITVKVINETELHLDSLIFSVGMGYDLNQELVYTDISPNSSSEIIYLDAIDIMYYEENSEYLYFTNYLTAVTEEKKLFETGWGFCGTGLIFETINHGNLKVLITGADLENNWLHATQYRE